MANAEIVVLGPAEIPLLTRLYNQIVRPPESEAFFKRQFQGRHNVLLLVAQLDGKPAGFLAGYELSPSTHLGWICGVLPDYRRAGIATQLLAAQRSWAGDIGYQTVRLECHNQHRAMLHLAITEGYNLVGVHLDPDSGDNLAIFERPVGE